MSEEVVRILAGVAAAGVIALAACRLALLTPSGAAAAFVLGALVFGIGGLAWSVPLVTFFVLSSLVSRLPDPNGAAARAVRGSRRDAVQVVANGGVVVLTLFWSLRDPGTRPFAAYVGALAAAAADTWATELGTRGRGRVISAATARPVEPGESGGVSLRGCLGAVLGASTVVLAASPFVRQSIEIVVVGVVAGFIGMLVDSILGATVQVRYRCAVCGGPTEQRTHHGQTTNRERGIAWFDNDVVNALCTLAGAAAAAMLWR